MVCEAKPQTVPSNYERTILGMLIQWRDEPAVDRSFRLQVPTVGMRAVSMPEDRRIVQSVEPIFYEGRLIAVLIYEKPAMAVEAMVAPMRRALEELVIEGIDTGAGLAHMILYHPDYLKGSYTTSFIPEHLDELLSWDCPPKGDDEA